MTANGRDGEGAGGPSQAGLGGLLFSALRGALGRGYGAKDLRRDVLAGVVVGLVALPLSMALAIAVGAPPQHGLYTAVTAGFVVALLGGSRTQVTGPTAAFIAVLAPVFTRYGLAGLLLSGMLAGFILILMGLLRLGNFIRYIPHPVTTGFTAGIAVVIASLQFKDLFGLSLEGNPEHFFERLAAMARAAGTASPAEFAVGAGTLSLLVLSPRLVRRVPGPLVALPLAAAGAAAAHHLWPAFEISTIATRFETVLDGQTVHGIPRVLPLPSIPWLAGAEGGRALPIDFRAVRELFPSAFAIAMLGAIESLLSAVIADGMLRTRHDPDAELLALGVGNVLTPFFGGIPATGAIARTATNIRSGGRSPVAAMVHAAVVLASMLALAPLIGYLPMASLAALLLIVSWNMAEAGHFLRILRVGPHSDGIVLVTCFVLTVVFDMVVAVSVGVVLAALLFMRRMAEVANARLSEGSHPDIERPLPPGVFVYDISGPLFFGAAQKATATLGHIADRARVVILRMNDVPAMDATGLVALESALEQLRQGGILSVITGLKEQPRRVLSDAGIVDRPGFLLVRRRFEDGLRAAEAHAASAAPGPS